MEDLKVIRGSELQDFLRCRYRWAEGWINNLEALKKDGKIFVGNLVHKYLEHYHWGATKEAAHHEMWQLFKEADTSRMEQVELDELWELAECMMNNYVDQWEQADSNKQTICTELTFVIQLDDKIAYQGTIDWIFEDKDGLLWFSDHKNTNSIDKYDKNSVMDRQISRYWWALQQLVAGKGVILVNDQFVPVQDTLFYQRIKHREVGGFIYNIMLRDIPKPPKLLKKGGFSKDKSQKTTYKMYINALEEQGFVEPIPEEYGEILQFLRDQETEQGNRYFKRIEVTRLQPEVNAAIAEFYHTANDLVDVETAIVDHGAAHLAYRNITHDCTWDCPFRALCLTQLEGGNVDLIRNTMYKVKEV